MMFRDLFIKDWPGEMGRIWEKQAVTQFTILPADDEDYEPPSYNTPGRVFFHYDPTLGESPWGIELFDYDGGVFWMVEGGFADQVIAELVDLELEGHYVLEGVHGYLSRSYEGEYDVDWTFELCRRASQTEIDTEALDDIKEPAQ